MSNIISKESVNPNFNKIIKPITDFLSKLIQPSLPIKRFPATCYNSPGTSQIVTNVLYDPETKFAKCNCPLYNTCPEIRKAKFINNVIQNQSSELLKGLKME